LCLGDSSIGETQLLLEHKLGLGILGTAPMLYRNNFFSRVSFRSSSFTWAAKRHHRACHPHGYMCTCSCGGIQSKESFAVIYALVFRGLNASRPTSSSRATLTHLSRIQFGQPTSSAAQTWSWGLWYGDVTHTIGPIRLRIAASDVAFSVRGRAAHTLTDKNTLIKLCVSLRSQDGATPSNSDPAAQLPHWSHQILVTAL